MHLPYLLLQVAATAGSVPRSSAWQLVGEGGAMALVLVVKHVFFDKKNEAKQTTTLAQKVEESQKKTAEQVGELRDDMRTLSLRVGEDAESGLRGDVREVKKRVIGLEDRERDRLEHTPATYDRRSK